MDNTTTTKTRREAPTAGPTRGARELFAIYYGGVEQHAKRERLIERFMAKAGLGRAGALDRLGKYARGLRVPELGTRHILRDIAGITIKAWADYGGEGR